VKHCATKAFVFCGQENLEAAESLNLQWLKRSSSRYPADNMGLNYR